MTIDVLFRHQSNLFQKVFCHANEISQICVNSLIGNEVNSFGNLGLFAKRKKAVYVIAIVKISRSGAQTMI